MAEEKVNKQSYPSRDKSTPIPEGLEAYCLKCGTEFMTTGQEDSNFTGRAWQVDCPTCGKTVTVFAPVTQQNAYDVKIVIDTAPPALPDTE